MVNDNFDTIGDLDYSPLVFLPGKLGLLVERQLLAIVVISRVISVAEI